MLIRLSCSIQHWAESTPSTESSLQLAADREGPIVLCLLFHFPFEDLKQFLCINFFSQTSSVVNSSSGIHQKCCFVLQSYCLPSMFRLITAPWSKALWQNWMSMPDSMLHKMKWMLHKMKWLLSTATPLHYSPAQLKLSPATWMLSMQQSRNINPAVWLWIQALSTATPLHFSPATWRLSMQQLRSIRLAMSLWMQPLHMVSQMTPGQKYQECQTSSIFQAKLHTHYEGTHDFSKRLNMRVLQCLSDAFSIGSSCPSRNCCFPCGAGDISHSGLDAVPNTQIRPDSDQWGEWVRQRTTECELNRADCELAGF